MDTPPIVAAQEWQAAWERLLVKEKELTRARDDDYSVAAPDRGWMDELGRGVEAFSNGDAS